MGDDDRIITLSDITFAEFGLAAGCHWGDDSSWKIQHLDLSKADQGILVRSDKFGYIELSDRMKLHEAIEYKWCSYEEKNGSISLITTNTYNLGEKD
jgi:hypothetical protein